MADTITRNRRVARVLGVAGPLLVMAWLLGDMWRGHHGGLQPGERMVFVLWVVSAALLSGGRLTIPTREVKIAAGLVAVCLAGEAVLMHFARQQPLGGWADMGVGFWPIIFGIGLLCFWFRQGTTITMSGRGDSFVWVLMFMIMFSAEDVLSPPFWRGVAQHSGWVTIGWVAAVVGGIMTGLGTRLDQRCNQRPIAES